MHFNPKELELIHFADLRMTTRPPTFDFEKDGDKAEELAKVLHEKMVEWQGAGLSANQVGLPYRMFVVGNKELIWRFFLRGVQSLNLRILLVLIFLFLMKFLIAV